MASSRALLSNWRMQCSRLSLRMRHRAACRSAPIRRATVRGIEAKHRSVEAELAQWRALALSIGFVDRWPPAHEPIVRVPTPCRCGAALVTRAEGS